MNSRAKLNRSHNQTRMYDADWKCAITFLSQSIVPELAKAPANYRRMVV
jgi:hypothetical protein